MAHLTDLIDWRPWNGANIEIGDFVKYYSHRDMPKQTTFEVIGFAENDRGQKILRLEHGGTIHPCYMMIDIKTQRKRKLKKINES